MQEPVEITVVIDAKERLDIFLAEEYPEVSRTKLKNWCSQGHVLVDGQVRKASFQLQGGEHIVIDPPQEPDLETLIPEDLPLEVVFEDEDLILINKAPGMVVHPGAGIHKGTLANALAFHFSKLSQQGGSNRPGIVHRLDKGTSGLILVAKTDQAHAHLSQQWQAGEVTKVYQALVWGVPDPPEGEIETHIGRHPRYRHKMAAEVEGGRWSKSRYKVTKAYQEAAQVNVHILTGRTHQIRVHMAHLGYPVVGDAMYGKNRHAHFSKSFEQMPDHPMLHAALLSFRHPTTGTELTFKQTAPEDFQSCGEALSGWPY
jgi:23S rRNA pseudouridine1911/1915/1917 synthase